MLVPEHADAFVMWTWAESSPEARRGHAYLFAERRIVRWLSFEHAPARTPAMLEQLERWQRLNPRSSALPARDRAWWKQPDGRWAFSGDLGRVLELLVGRELVCERGDDGELLPELPERFLRRPIACMVEAAIGPVEWPRSCDAEHVRVGPAGIRAARKGPLIAIAAARYGSLHEGVGQDRTAAIWCSYDHGASWIELPWVLDPAQAHSPAGQCCWPPEELLAVALIDGEPVIEWEDPWIDWEPGNAWRAVWRSGPGNWRMQIR